MTRLRAYLGVRLLRPWLVAELREAAGRLGALPVERSPRVRSEGYSQGVFSTLTRILELPKR